MAGDMFSRDAARGGATPGHTTSGGLIHSDASRSGAIPRRFQALIDLAAQMGLDFFDIKFEVIPWDVMNEIAAYGLPIRAHHWSYGRVYQRQRIHGQMGLSKIYEIVLNNDPAYAFLLDTNAEIENLLIVAHVAAHADFFKNNIWFKETNRNMVAEAAEHAVRIEQYKDIHGLEAVERLMDIAFALERHIDPHKGLYRRRYPEKEVVEREVRSDPYDDLRPEGPSYSLRREVRGGELPPHPEKDLLWFLAQYAPLEAWERDVLEMVREEAYYFYPQFNTKILNEGWASFWHAEIMNAYDELTPEEMIEFSRLHSNVVRPAGRFQLNPYYLGYKILVDVEKRWNELKAKGESPIDGRQKLFEIRELEDDFSFIRNYLTKELAEELGLYTYGPACDCPPNARRPCPRCGDIVIQSRDLPAVVEGILKGRYNYGVPKVVVAGTERGTLRLVQEDKENGGLEPSYAEKTLEYIHQLWKRPVVVETYDSRGGEIVFTFDDAGFHVMKGRPAR